LRHSPAKVPLKPETSMRPLTRSTRKKGLSIKLTMALPMMSPSEAFRYLILY
jgi:hypothetical protein